MKNKEKYAEQVLSFACKKYDSFGVYAGTDEMESCKIMTCEECAFLGMKNSCHTEKLKWLESEYIEKPAISKKDRAFLEYLGTVINYITRDMDGGLFIYISKPHKLIDCWESSGCELDKSLKSFRLDFPMVKWQDSKPWLIEDLKKLEVVEKYEQRNTF